MVGRGVDRWRQRSSRVAHGDSPAAISLELVVEFTPGYLLCVLRRGVSNVIRRIAAPNIAHPLDVPGGTKW